LIMKSLLLTLTYALGTSEEAGLGVGPIRRIVSLLQAMQKKVTEEGEKEAELYEKFVCYCKSNEGELTASIAKAQDTIAQLDTQVREDTGAKTALDEELKNHKQAREEATSSLGSATEMREKDAATYAKESADMSMNIEALKKAIEAITTGLSGGAFLQTYAQAGHTLKQLVTKIGSLRDVDRESLTAFLSNSATAPGSSEIVGILKEMSDEMQRDYKEMVDQEQGAIKVFNELQAAKTKEIAAATAAVEKKTQRSGELAVKIMQGHNDLQDTMDALSEDEQFQVNLRRDCALKAKEQNERVKMRAEELQAIAETIKIMNDDEALDLFKKTVPSPKGSSFLQEDVTRKAIQSRLQNIVSSAARTYQSTNLDLISLALRGKKVDFTKVLKMIDDLVEVLKQEQKDDDEHKAYCEKEFDVSDDKKKATERRVADLTHEKEDANTASANLAKEILVLQAGIAALDKSVADATTLRKAEHAEYVETAAANSAAMKLIEFAKNRLNKFYNPKLYKEPEQRNLTEEQRITQNFGGEIEPVVQNGIAGTGITAFLQLEHKIGTHTHTHTHAAPGPPPETFGAYTKKSEENNGVMGLMDMLKNDIAKDNQAAELEEKDSQAEYEQLMRDSQKKRAADSKSITTKEAAKAEADSVAETASENLASSNSNLYATKEYISNLHKSCDFLVENYDFRKEARAAEIEALKKAHAVLRGSDYSLVETKSFLRKVAA